MEIHHKIAGLIIKDKKILVTRKYDEPHFIIPGGRVEEGESARETLARELKEELSITLIDMIYWSTHQAVHVREIRNFSEHPENQTNYSRFSWF